MRPVRGQGGEVFVRALVAFLVLPGLVAFAIPAAWIAAGAHARIVQPLGLAPLIGGALALAACARDFLVRGKGTLAPWSPPTRLVVAGLYRWSRNPMYVAVTAILLGWAATFDVAGLYAYAACVAVAFHLRVVFAEEPWLARTHGDAWVEYAQRVPRWLGWRRH